MNIMHLKKNKILLLLVMIVLISSLALAEDNVCTKKLKNSQAKSIDPSNGLVKTITVSSKTYYETIKGDRKGTRFRPNDVLIPFDAYIVQDNGEVEVFKSYGTTCKSIGFFSGEFITLVPFELEELTAKYVKGYKSEVVIFGVTKGQFRRVNKIQGKDYEVTFFDPKYKSVLFIWLKKYNYYYLASTNVLISPTNGENFKKDLKSLPTGDYYKVSCTEKDSKGKDKQALVWWYLQKGDSYAVKGDCKVTVESADSINKQVNKKSYSIADEYTIDIKTGKKSASFSLVPYKDDKLKPQRFYNLHFWGKPYGIQVDGVEFSKKTNQPDVLVIKDSSSTDYDAIKIFSARKKLYVKLTENLKNKKVWFSSYTYGTSAKHKGYVHFVDKGGKYFMTLVTGAIEFFKTNTNQESKEFCESYTHPGTELYRKMAACYYIDNQQLIIPSPKGEFNINLITNGNDNFDIIYRHLRDVKYGQVAGSIANLLGSKNATDNVDVDDLKDKNVKIIWWQNWKKRIYIVNAMKVKTVQLFKGNLDWTPGIFGNLKFGTFVYDDKAEQIRNLQCDSALGECTLDGQKISGPRVYNTCRQNSDCNDGKICTNSVCVNKPEDCTSYQYGTGNFDLHVFGIDMTESELKSYMGKIFPKFFTYAPFDKTKNNFNIKYRPIGHIDALDNKNIRKNEFYSNLIQNAALSKNKCQGVAPDVTLIISPHNFVPFAKGNLIFIGTKYGNVQNYEAQVFAHEFGHALGDLADEYVGKGKLSNTGINCGLPSIVKPKWEDLGFIDLDLTAKAKGWYGCGANCLTNCNSYIRPSENSLMRDHTIATSYNGVSQAVLKKEIDKYNVIARVSI
jgi:hypothetical protein